MSIAKNNPDIQQLLTQEKITEEELLQQILLIAKQRVTTAIETFKPAPIIIYQANKKDVYKIIYAMLYSVLNCTMLNGYVSNFCATLNFGRIFSLLEMDFDRRCSNSDTGAGNPRRFFNRPNRDVSDDALLDRGHHDFFNIDFSNTDLSNIDFSNVRLSGSWLSTSNSIPELVITPDPSPDPSDTEDDDSDHSFGH